LVKAGKESLRPAVKKGMHPLVSGARFSEKMAFGDSPRPPGGAIAKSEKKTNYEMTGPVDKY